MKRLILVSGFIMWALSTTAANACPKGTHPTGGTGPHHKGGKCTLTITTPLTRQ